MRLAPGAWFWLGVATFLTPFSLAAERPPVAIDAPLREKVARYHYYQGAYFPALSELLVMDERKRQASIDLSEQNTLALEGAIRLAFGMPGTALEQLNKASLASGQEDAAHFYLGKLHYLRGDRLAAGRAWARVGDSLRPALAREWRARRLMLELGREQPPEPEPAQLWADLQDWAPILLFNLGAERARAGDYSGARHYYQALAREAPEKAADSEEYRVLRDRALTAAGYTHLLESNLDAAQAAFAQVRLEQPRANRALLGYGWALAELEQYRQALSPWQLLSQRAGTDPSVQESLLALPYAYEQLGLPQAALEAYDRAEAVLADELEKVITLERELNPQSLLTVMNRELGAGALGSDWLSPGNRQALALDSDYLLALVRKSEFQTQVQQVQDLLQQHRVLSQWRPKLEHYRQLLRNKAAQRQGEEAKATRRALFERAQRLHRERWPLAEELARIREQRDYFALAGEREQAQLERLSQARQAAERLAETGRDTTEAQARLALYEGILLWRAAQVFPDRLWRVEKQLAQLDSALEETRTRRERLERLVATDLDIRPSLARIDQLDTGISTQQARLETALQQSARQLASVLSDQLLSERDRLKNYLARARLAGARLQDRALRGAQP